MDTDTISPDDLTDLAEAFRKGVELKDRKYRLTTYKQCFVGSEAVDFLMSSGAAEAREDAVQLGNALSEEYHLFEHVTRDHDFKDDRLFYRFVDEGERGSFSKKEGKAVTWSDFLAPASGGHHDSLLPTLPVPDFEAISKKDAHAVSQVWPLDEYNTTLLNHVHPPDWKDPLPNQGDNASTYDLVVIGAGAGGLVTSAGAAGVGAKVALIEENLLGGDCLNVGCVPSKALIHSANLAHTLCGESHLEEAGLSIKGGPTSVEVDFEKVMERVRSVRAEISHHDSAERYTKELGVDVFIGRGKFTSDKTVEVNGRTLTFKRAVIATGGYPTLIPMEGIKELHDEAVSIKDPPMPRPAVMTNETFFNLTSQPKNMVCIGAGVIGLELSQAMQRLGTSVTVLGRSGKVLPKEDQDLAQLVKDQMMADGVMFLLTVDKYVSLTKTGKILDNGLPEMMMKLCMNGSSNETELICDAVLVAAGRRPNVTGMDLEAAGVEYDTKKGLVVNDKLQTTNPRVYGVGDCCSAFKFTHAADFMARAVIRNSLFFGKEKMSNLLIPYATFTSPEIASVGLYERDLKDKGIPFRIIDKPFYDNDRNICDSDRVGLVRFRVDAKIDKILGASIVGSNAGNMIGEVTLAMQSDTGLGALAAVIHPYPTTSEVLRQAGDLYNKTRLTTTVKSLLRGVIKIQR